MQMARRIETVARGERFVFTVLDGTSSREIVAYEGETIATALLAAGITSFRYSVNGSRPHGVFCAAGSCFDCRVEVEGVPDMRACVTYARPGMSVRLPGRPVEDGS
jgi:predicted molibdopterin-dependent oxidoreductase YjgC